MSRLLVRTPLLGLLFVLLSLPAAAEELSGELGLWLTETVAPKLKRHVGQHPRFAGTTLQFVALRDGQPNARSNALIAAVHDYLKHRLLEQSQARVAWQTSADVCQREVGPQVLVGVEIEALDRRQYQVSIGALDPEERVWLPGTSFRWRGQLSSGDRRALGRLRNNGIPGSRLLPLPAKDAEAISEALVARLRCQFPYGLTGSAQLTEAGSKNREALRTALSERLVSTGLAEIKDEEQGERWQLELRSARLGSGLERLSLLARSEGNQQQLASVFLDTAAEASAGPRTPARQPANRVQLAQEIQLSELEPRGIEDCGKALPGSLCQVVELQLDSPAYLFSFRTVGEQIEPSRCQSAPELTDPGRRRYRLPTEEAEAIGFYAVATAEPASARAMAKLLRETGSFCGSGRRLCLKRWLAKLEAIEARDDSFIWRAINLDSGGEQAFAVAD